MNFIKAKSLARAFGQGRQVGGRCDIIKPPWIGFLHETWYIAWLRSLIRGKYILIAKILAYLNIKRDITFSQLKIRISQRRPIKVKTFKWISVTKIQYYPCRGSEKSIKEKKNRLLSRAQLPSYLCMLQHRERGNNPLRVPSIFRCRDKVFGVYVKTYSAVYTRTEKIDASNEVHSRCLSTIRFAANSILDAFLTQRTT